MRKQRILVPLLCAVILAACLPIPTDEVPDFTTPTQPAASTRERMKSIQDYMVFYGTGRADELARYDLAIVQPDTLTDQEISDLKSKGTLVTAYLSVGEVEPNRAWYTDGRADPRWILGKNQDWGSYFIDANQPGWQELMIDLTGEFLQKGYDGVFLDTVDTVSIFPETTDGMIALIHGLRQAYPQALLIQNRGMEIAEEVAGDLDAIMFEDVSTTYDFEKQEYSFRNNTDEIDSMSAFMQKSGLPILGLDYAPADNPGMAYKTIKISRENGFIPCVSTINLDDIPDYHLDGDGSADVRVTRIGAEGDEHQVDLVTRIENTGLTNAVDVTVSIQVGEAISDQIKLTMEPGDVYDWSVPWTEPVENSQVKVSILHEADPTPENNELTWTFTYASIAMEPLLPYDQQKHRPVSNGPALQAVFLTDAPVIDADLTEWMDLPCTQVNTAEQISYGDPSQWMDEHDLSGQVCYGWDEENIYLAITINDDIRVQKYTGGNLWQGDHVELWFDTQLQLDFDSETDSDDDYQIGISPGDDADVPADFFIFTPDIPAETYASEVEWQVKSTDDGYQIEARIPKKVLKGLRVGEGQTIGVTFEPSDTDTPGSSDQELMMSTATQSSTNWGNPTVWNNLTFVKE